MKRTVLWSLLVLFLLACGYWGGYVQLNHNFFISHITLDEWTPANIVPVSSPEEAATAKKILDQPFTYLGRGRQSFAFVSQDGKYVLKFIKAHRVNTSNLYKSFPLPGFLDTFRNQKLRQSQKDITRLLMSFSLAKDPLQKMTGLIYLHTAPIQKLQKQVTLIDRIGFTHHVDIDSVPFLLQLKADHVWKTLKTLLKKKDIPALKNRLSQLVALFVERTNYGIIDPDKQLLKNNNIGFIEDRAIYIDLGTFSESTKSQNPKYLRKNFSTLKPIVHWLQEHDRDLAHYFEQQMEDAIQAMGRTL